MDGSREREPELDDRKHWEGPSRWDVARASVVGVGGLSRTGAHRPLGTSVGGGPGTLGKDYKASGSSSTKRRRRKESIRTGTSSLERERVEDGESEEVEREVGAP